MFSLKKVMMTICAFVSKLAVAIGQIEHIARARIICITFYEFVVCTTVSVRAPTFEQGLSLFVSVSMLATLQ